MPPKKQTQQQEQTLVSTNPETKSQTLGLKDVNEELRQKIKEEISQKITQETGMDDIEEIVNYVIQQVLDFDKSRDEIQIELEEFFQEKSKTLTDWMFDTLSPKYQSMMGSIFNQFTSTNDEFAEFNNEQVKLPSTVGAKGEFIQQKKQQQQKQNLTQGNNAAGKMLIKASQDAQQSTKQQQLERPKKVIHLDKGSQDQKETQEKSEIFNRISKKRTIEERPQKNVDLETLIKQDRESTQQTHPFKRQKKDLKDEPKQLEEIKIDANQNTVIDLNTHKNNIRVRKPERQEVQPQQTGQTILEDKKKIRCRHWPNCKYPDEECEYIHPKEECPFFPKCQYGAKCIYRHPDIECKFGVHCTRQNCAYQHPKGRVKPFSAPFLNPQMQKAMGMMMAGMMMKKGPMPQHKKYIAGKETQQQQQEGQEHGDNAQQENATTSS